MGFVLHGLGWGRREVCGYKTSWDRAVRLCRMKETRSSAVPCLLLAANSPSCVLLPRLCPGIVWTCWAMWHWPRLCACLNIGEEAWMHSKRCLHCASYDRMGNFGGLTGSTMTKACGIFVLQFHSGPYPALCAHRQTTPSLGHGFLTAFYFQVHVWGYSATSL